MPPFALSRAAFVCIWRRGATRAGRSRLAAGAGILALAGLGALAVTAGRRAGAVLGPAVAADGVVAASLALSLGAAAVLAGAAVATLAPRRSFLGSQLQAAPVSRLAVFLLVTAAPVAVGGAMLAGLALAFLVPAAAPSPGGAGAGLAAVLAGAAGFALGAAAAEAAIGVLRGSLRAVVPLAGVALVWVFSAAGAGKGGVAGPFGYLAAALRDAAPARWEAEPALGVAAAAGAVLWAAAAALRPDERPARGRARRLVPVGRGALRATAAASLSRYARRSELRRQAAAVVVLAGGGGLLLQRVVPVGAEPALVFGGGLAALGAAVLPLAAPGVDREAEWLWRAAPRPRAALAAASGLAALAGGLAVALAGVLPLAAAAGAPAAPLFRLLALTAFVLGAGLLAGALVPWRSDRTADELASLAALGVVAGALWLGLARVVGALEGVVGVVPATAGVLTLELGLALAAAAALASRGEC